MAIELRNDCSRIAQRLGLLREQSDGSMLKGMTATGSYWVQDGIWYLITNWHNLTCCKPSDGQPLLDNAFLPTHVEISLLTESSIPDASLPEGQYVKTWRRFNLPLYENENEARWYEHPAYRNKVDVVAMPVFIEADCPYLPYSLPLNRHDWFDLRLQPGDDAFVLGYPKNMDGGGQLPLWKRASIASEPTIDYDGLPLLLVDTATRPGMSGSPVIAVSNGWNIPQGGGMQDAIIGRVEAFIGIYSGRTDDDQLGVQIGKIWKGLVISQILIGKVRGHNPLNP